MSKLERRHYSLETRTFRATIMGAIIMGMVALIVGIVLYAIAIGDQQLSTSFNLSRSAKGFLEMKDYMDLEKLTSEVLDIYNNMTAEEQAECETDIDKYRKHFEHLTDSPDYIAALSALKYFKDSSDVYDIYVAVYDYDNQRLIYIVDPEPDPEYACFPGDWEKSSPSGYAEMYNWKAGDKRPYSIENVEKYGWLGSSGVPLVGSSGSYALIMADVSLSTVSKAMGSFTLNFVIAMFIIVNLVAVIMTLHMKKTLVKPINQIADAATKYTEDKKNGIKDTHYFSDLHISTGDELENLALIMSDMETDLADYDEHLSRVISEKERVGTELALATRIQADMLPNIFPAFPENHDFDIYAVMNPAKEVGGDFYDFFKIDEDHLALVIADVSGKGIPAALFMMISKILVQNLAMTGISPKEVLQQVNAQIYAHNKEEMFVTVWLGILDLRNGKLTCSNAGHEYPLVKQSGGSFEIVKDRHGFVIGGMECIRYTDYEIQLTPGSKLFVYTDGVPEATNSDKQLFGLERLLDAINSVKDMTPQDVIEEVSNEVTLFVGEAPQFDDLTMLCLSYTGRDNDSMNESNQITIEATVENIEKVTDFVNAKLEALDCSLKIQTQIDVAIDELFSNIAHYAYDPETGPATVIVDVEEDPLSVIITFMDNGKPYDPLSNEDPDITLSAEDRKIGGLGVFLVKKTMDDVSYEYKDGRNILRIKKKI
ncbi:MAG: SpoIIE family protein phosphatase [Clostridia bacterium]|nr:SpoIIE family protein phosphatase [Clostridia bacterium]